LFPLSEDTSELLGRTRPDIRDVLIAFFGGLALIIARTKKGTIASVIFGVAIATALMPPLCTAGYGLAKGNWQFFGGAMYLFTINTIFIALATFVVLKVLRFPMLKYANSAKRKRISRFATLIALVAMIPAIWTFLKVLQESKYDMDYKSFVDNEIKTNPNLWLQRDIIDKDAKKISLYFNGDVSDEMISDIQNEKRNYENLEDFELIINANKTRSADRLIQSLDRAYAELDSKDNIIDGLQKQITELESNITSLNKLIESKNTNQNAVSFSALSRDAKVRFNDLEYFGYARMLESKDFINIDTVTVANVRWKVALGDSAVLVRERALQKWLKEELKVDTIFVKRN
jgi:nitrogen fixation/metabolism regulation signal transduction histidine kinase